MISRSLSALARISRAASSPLSAVPQGDAVPFGLHPGEDALLHLRRKVQALDAHVQHFDAELPGQHLGFVGHRPHDLLPLFPDDLDELVPGDLLAQARADDLVQAGERAGLRPYGLVEGEGIDDPQRAMWSTTSRFLSSVRYSSALPSAISTRLSK